MVEPRGFGEVLDAAGKLDADEQAELVAILSRRLAELGRARVADTVAHARREHAERKSKPMKAAEIVREAQP